MDKQIPPLVERSDGVTPQRNMDPTVAATFGKKSIARGGHLTQDAP